MAEPDDQSPPKPLDYAAPARRGGLSRPTAIALATMCLVIGIPICAIGAGVLTAVSGFDDRDLWRSLGFIALGGIFCFAGMRLRRPPAGPANSDWRVLATLEPPRWSGDLNDDCTALWAGFMLRAEWMHDDNWWWCVYQEGSTEQIASSNDSDAEPCSTGDAARSAAERAARHLLGLRPEA